MLTRRISPNGITTMGLLTKLFKNMSYLTVGNQLGNLLQFLFFLYFARQFGDGIVGQYSFAFSFTYLFSVLADLGLSAYLIREVARDRSGNRQIFARCLSLRLFSIVFFSLLAVATVLVFLGGFSKEAIKIIVLLGLFHIFFSIADVFLAELKGHDRMGLVALLSLFLRFLISSAGILLIMLGYDFLTALTCFPIASFIYLIVCIYLSFYYFGSIQTQFRDLNLGGLFINILPFALTIIFVETLYHQDILMLRILQDDQSVGIYSVANKIVLVLLGLVPFVHIALLPTYSRLYVDSKSKLIDVAKQSLRYMLLIGLPIATGLYAISDKLIVFLFSDAFSYSADALEILSCTLAFGYTAATYSVLLTAINRQTEKAICIAICLAFNFVLNLALIPKLSYNGAATAKLMTEALHFILMAYLVSRYLPSISIHKVFVKPALSCVLMYIFIRVLYQWNLFCLILMSAVVYFLSLVALRGYTKEEGGFIKRLYNEKVLRLKRTFET